MKVSVLQFRALVVMGTLLQIGLNWNCSLAHSQVVQLPSTRNFSYTGGAIVPDAGTGYLGGVSSLSQGSVSRGGLLLPGRAIGAGGGIAGASVSVDVIDLEALDQAILTANVPLDVLQAQQNTSATSAETDADRARRFISSYRSVSEASELLDHRDFQRSLTSSPDQRLGQESLAESNIRFYLQKGQEAENSSRIQAARVYYRLALDSMTPRLLDRYQRFLAARQQAEKDQINAANASRKPF